jgi:hypothetical protein
MSTREHEVVIGHNDDLRHELDMYKSVVVPIENKPRTNITRIGRPPLVNMNHCFNLGANGSKSLDGNDVQGAKVLNGIPGTTTLEEII